MNTCCSLFYVAEPNFAVLCCGAKFRCFMLRSQVSLFYVAEPKFAVLYCGAKFRCFMLQSQVLLFYVAEPKFAVLCCGAKLLPYRRESNEQLAGRIICVRLFYSELFGQYVHEMLFVNPGRIRIITTQPQ